MNFKAFLQKKGITDDAFKNMDAGEQAKLHGEFLDELSKSVEGAAKSTDIEALKTQITDLTTKGATAEALKAATDKIDLLATEIAEMKAEAGASNKSFQEQLKEFLAEKHEELKNLHTAGKGFLTFTPKAPETITTGRGVNTNPPNIIGTQIAPLQNVNLREIPVLQLTNNLNTDLAAYPYTEAIPGEGDAALVAEGAAKPQIDFDWETNYAKPFKVAAWIKLTEEAVQDVRGLQDVAENYLRKKHDLRKSRLILYGTGTSGQPTGGTVYGRPFVAGDMAGKVRFANFMDVVNAAVTDIATTHNYQDEMPYMANLVLVNPVDFFTELVSAKDERGLPLYPQASLFNRVVIGGITILPEESIPAGKIFVSDMEKYNTTNYMPYTVKIGWVNDDFIKNQFVILGESRFHAFVKKLDEQAFIYDDIETIKTAISEVVTP